MGLRMIDLLQKPKLNAWKLGFKLFGKHSSGMYGLAANRKILIKDKIKRKNQNVTHSP